MKELFKKLGLPVALVIGAFIVGVSIGYVTADKSCWRLDGRAYYNSCSGDFYLIQSGGLRKLKRVKDE